MSRVKNRKKKATVDLRVQIKSRVVKMNQPCVHALDLIEVTAHFEETYHQVEAKGVVKGQLVIGSQAGDDVEPARSKDDRSTNPESSVRRQRCRTKGVANGHLPIVRQHIRLSVIESFYSPHASQKLDETTICESRADNEIWRIETAGAKIDQRQQECCQGEGGQTQRSRVGEFALRVDLVGTGLEVTTEGR